MGLKNRILPALLIFCLLWGLGPVCLAAEPADLDRVLDRALEDTAAYLCQAVEQPGIGSIGGDWTVLGLARGGCRTPEGYYQRYLENLERIIQARQGVLHQKKYTEYSRVILALSALGADARQIGGYDLTEPLGDYDSTVAQGINGPVWALLALDSRQYPMPVNRQAKTQATRQLYLDFILDRQLPEGGWSLTGRGEADPDLTGMALQALAKYQRQQRVKEATEKALVRMSALQDDQGGFSAWGAANSESTVQMLCALCELGIPLDDPRFVKNGSTLLDSLLSFYQQGSGFRHRTDGSGSNLMATEQGLYALAALRRARQGENSLYRMDDAQAVFSGPQPGRLFSDIPADHPNRQAIEALAARGILTGKGNGLFEPQAPVTRAEFAALMARGLGLAPQQHTGFADVQPGDWFAGYVGAACHAGIITGRGGGCFDPQGLITRQEAALMVTRAAGLWGMDTGEEAGLARFSDYESTPAWARPGLAFCWQQGILEIPGPEIKGGEQIRRGQVAQMVYQLLADRLL